MKSNSQKITTTFKTNKEEEYVVLTKTKNNKDICQIKKEFTRVKPEKDITDGDMNITKSDLVFLEHHDSLQHIFLGKFVNFLLKSNDYGMDFSNEYIEYKMFEYFEYLLENNDKLSEEKLRKYVVLLRSTLKYSYSYGLKTNCDHIEKFFDNINKPCEIPGAFVDYGTFRNLN